MDRLLRFFEYEHLPERLRPVSKACADLAQQMVRDLPPGAETTVGLRKLLEAKDAFVRAAIVDPPASSEADGDYEGGGGQTGGGGGGG